MIYQKGAYLTVDRALEQASALGAALPGGGILMKTIFRRVVARVRAWTAAKHREHFYIHEKNEAAARRERYAASATAEMASRPWR